MRERVFKKHERIAKCGASVITDKYIGSLREHLTDREHQKKTFTQHQSYKKTRTNHATETLQA